MKYERKVQTNVKNEFRFRTHNSLPLLKVSKLRLIVNIFHNSTLISFITTICFIFYIMAMSFIFRNLNDNKIPEIRKVHFENCLMISDVYLSNNEIGIVEDRTFEHRPSMKSL